MTVRDIIAEPLEVMKMASSREEVDERVRKLQADAGSTLNICRFPMHFPADSANISIATLVSRPRFVWP